jgi:hypothetical protein
VAINLASKPGLTSAAALSIPKDWDSSWFRSFINNLLKGGDVRNAVGANGIVVSGTIASPYATISLGPGPIVLNTPAGTVALTVNGASGQQALVVNGPETIHGVAGSPALTVIQASGSPNTVWSDSGGTNTATMELFGTTYALSTTGPFQLAPTGILQLASNGTVWYTLGTTGGITNVSPTGNISAMVLAGSASATAAVGTLACSANTSGVGVAAAFTGRAGTVPGLAFNSMAATGAATPTLGSNKPGGATSPTTWLRVLVDGVSLQIPCWA